MFQATSETIVNISLYVEATSCPLYVEATSCPLYVEATSCPTIFGKRYLP